MVVVPYRPRLNLLTLCQIYMFLTRFLRTREVGMCFGDSTSILMIIVEQLSREHLFILIRVPSKAISCPTILKMFQYPMDKNMLTEIHMYFKKR